MSQKTFRVGGVPEHFNYPWKYALQEGLFKEQTLEVSWQDYPGGTGAMAKDLREDKVDIALMLTEGAIADIIQGNPSKIIGTYVESALIWGVHVNAQSPLQHLSEVDQANFAISRYGSGSHLMAFVLAKQWNWPANSLTFEVVGNFTGAQTALKAHPKQLFMWEKFTTQPTVDLGEWRRIGECPTPWPCFVMVVREEVLENYASEILKIIEVARNTQDQLDRPNTLKFISKQYQLSIEQVTEWFEQTQWLCKAQIQHNTLENTQKILQELKIIEHSVSPNDLCSKYCEII